MIKLNSKEFASMIIELAKVNEDSNNDIHNIELLDDSSIDINIYSNKNNSNDTSYIVCIYADYLYNNDIFTAELFFSVQHEIITCSNKTTDNIVVAYLHAINQH